MKQFRTLVYFEVKKVLKQKSTWITFGILFLFQILLSLSPIMGSTYINGEYFESNVESIKTDRAYGEAISGRLFDDEFFDELRAANQYYQKNGTVAYYRSDSYQKKYRPYEGPMAIITSFSNYSIYRIDTMTTEKLLEARDELLKRFWSGNQLTLDEKRYWINQEQELPTVYTYQYAKAYETLIDTSGCYMSCMVVTFFIAVCMSSIFVKEHTRRTDQLILCSQYGRKMNYFAKLCAGVMISLCACIILLGTSILCNFAIFGTGGFTASIQLIYPWTSQNFTVGEVFLMFVLILLLSTVLIGLLAMVLSEVLHSNIASMAILIGIMFLARIRPISKYPRIISLLINCIPINQVYTSGFFEPRLFKMFGQYATTWQVAPVIYIVLGIITVFIGKRIYCNYQVDGR